VNVACACESRSTSAAPHPPLPYSWDVVFNSLALPSLFVREDGTERQVCKDDSDKRVDASHPVHLQRDILLMLLALDAQGDHGGSLSVITKCGESVGASRGRADASLRGAVPNLSISAVEALLGWRIDTLFVDCEGCIERKHFQRSNPVTSWSIACAVY
jgi:hypothetical protein